MKEEKVIDQFTATALKYLESGEAFLKREVPIYIEEVLSFKLLEHFLNFLFLATLIALCAQTIRFLWKKMHKGSEYDAFEYQILIGLLILFLGGLTFGAFDEAMSCLKVKMAPRVYLIEYLKKGKEG